MHYLAVPPVAFTGLTKALGQHNLAKGARVVYEKPFGTSPKAFRELDRAVHSVLSEQQVYRIDHFLGKEATQDLHVLRFANGLFAGMWDRLNVESVQIDVPERLGITDRSVFYDATGAVLDMLITHLFQVAAEVAMEPPASLEPAACRRPARRSSGRSASWTRPRSCSGSSRLSGRARRGGAVEAEHLRRRPAVDRQPALARGAVLPSHRQAAGGLAAARQPHPPQARRPAGGAAS